MQELQRGKGSGNQALRHRILTNCLLLVYTGGDRGYHTGGGVGSKYLFDWMDMISLKGKTNFFEKRMAE